MSERRRLDQVLVDRGLVDTRSLARRLVLAGQVKVDGKRVDKPGTPVMGDARLEVDSPPRYVSRGGEKLESALEQSGIAVRGRVALDLGASTGGFTDCLLQHGAEAVVAVDVGYGQLDWGLRQNPRVHVLERTNARHLQTANLPDALPGPLDLAVMDVSFIGAAKMLPALSRLLAPASDALLLVKPQFEAGPSRVQKGGVVRDAATRRDVIRSVAEAAAADGWRVVSALPSPLRGPAGNWECFLYLRRDGEPGAIEFDLDSLAVPDDRGQPEDTRA